MYTLVNPPNSRQSHPMLTRAFAILILLCALLLLLIQASTPQPITLTWGPPESPQTYTTSLTIAVVGLLALLVALFCFCYSLLYASLIPSKISQHLAHRQHQAHLNALLHILTNLALNQPQKAQKHTKNLSPEDPLTQLLNLQLGKLTAPEVEALTTHPILGPLAKEKQALNHLLPDEKSTP
ncbi:MAG: hypothetical protein EBQ80_01840 [Proteobacteria bacterium]|nr:hypothetical protein [Pseudomonadota bacterium]